MIPVPRSIYNAAMWLVILFLFVMASVYGVMLAYMAINHIEADGSAFTEFKLMLFSGAGIVLGGVFKPSA